MTAPEKISAGAFKKHVVEVVDRVKRALLFDLDNRLVLATPVLTGRVRAGWIGTSGDPAGTAPDLRTEKDPIPKGQLPQGYAVPNVRPSTNPNMVYWETNNVEYISFLNDGSSEQAPKMFVEAAVLATTDKGQKIADAIDKQSPP